MAGGGAPFISGVKYEGGWGVRARVEGEAHNVFEFIPLVATCFARVGLQFLKMSKRN